MRPMTLNRDTKTKIDTTDKQLAFSVMLEDQIEEKEYGRSIPASNWRASW